MVGGLVQKQHEGPNEESSEDRKGQSQLSLMGVTQKGTVLPVTAIRVRPGLSPETNSRFDTSEKRKN